MTTIDSFVLRLRKLKIEVELTGNYPWIYLTKINGIPVKEKRYSDHAYTLCLIEFSGNNNYLDIHEVFILIRKHLNETKTIKEGSTEQNKGVE